MIVKNYLSIKKKLTKLIFGTPDFKPILLLHFHDKCQEINNRKIKVKNVVVEVQRARNSVLNINLISREKDNKILGIIAFIYIIYIYIYIYILFFLISS
jgi:hypothetical protein